MTFELRLTVSSALSRIEAGRPQYDPELDDITSVLRDICEYLEAHKVGFLVRICSEDYWPVTVRTDLLVVIEQLGDVLASLAQEQVGQLEFYEQGVERVVLIVPQGGALLVQCSDLIAKPTSQTESMSVSRELLFKELASLADDFIYVSRACCEQLTEHPWFAEWAFELQQQVKGIRQSQ